MKNLFKYVVVIVKYFSRIAYYFRNSTTKFFLEKNKQKSSVWLPKWRITTRIHSDAKTQKSNYVIGFGLLLYVPLFVNAVSYNQSKSNYKYCNN